ncbi:MAG: arylsulfatase [Verrucomicrobia bacterium]|nr:arylsulfatase [Verrucomicrobiota bacterium]MDA1069590.1 arylsulfatase [Verrucomicrobiota bacterium]
MSKYYRIKHQRSFLKEAYIVGLLALLGVTAAWSQSPSQSPNILFIYLDDLGYGDVSFSNPESKIPTPHIDRLAHEGISFTDAHVAASVCGPSRYGLLTGRYPWRRGKGGTSNGAKFRDLFIENGRMTVASLLKQKNYNTGQFGKWGLRHNYSEAVLPGKSPGDLDAYDFKKKRLMGAQLVGFDYSWCITYLDKEDSNIKSQFENGSPLDSTLAPTDPFRWLPDSANKVVEYLESYAGKKINPKFGIDPEQPFFIYWDPPSPHEPIVPNKAFTGTSGAGLYGDFVVEIDHYIGDLLDALDRLNLTENTLVIFASDNGPDSTSYERVKTHEHYSMGHRRGIKTDILEGGHRLPLVVCWPGMIQPDQTSDQLVSFTDWFATLAELTGQSIPAGAGEDSLSFLELLLKGSLKQPYRENMIHHTPGGEFAVRQKDWIFIDHGPPESSEPEWFREERKVKPHSFPGQLYNLKDDPTQSINLYGEYPERVQEMKSLLKEAKKINP